jgi:superfamily I DNA/RNA helicase
VDDAYREVAEILTTDRGARANYSAIVVDETQDFGPQALRLLRALIPAGANDLLFVGDGHQRIYSHHQAAMGRCGIDIRGRSRKLYLNYRTTDEIRRQAVALLEGCEVDDLDEGRDESRRYKSVSHGPEPRVVAVAGLEDAAKEAIDFIRQWQAAQTDAGALTYCVVTPSEKTRDSLAVQLQAAGFTCAAITAQSNHTDVREAVHLATMHRAKGLEFDCVIVVAPSAYLGEVEQTEAQRKLLYVALTRAKRGAMLAVMG